MSSSVVNADYNDSNSAYDACVAALPPINPPAVAYTRCHQDSANNCGYNPNTHGAIYGYYKSDPTPDNPDGESSQAGCYPYVLAGCEDRDPITGECPVPDCIRGDTKRFQQCNDYVPPDFSGSESDFALPPHKKDLYDEKGCHYSSGDTPVDHKYTHQTNGNGYVRTCVSEEYTASGAKAGEDTPADEPEQEEEEEKPSTETEQGEKVTQENPDGTTSETETELEQTKLPGTTVTTDNSVIRYGDKNYNKTTTTTTTTNVDGSTTTVVETTYNLVEYGDVIYYIDSNTGHYGPSTTTSSTTTTTTTHDSDGNETSTNTTGDDGNGTCNPAVENCGPDEGPFQGGKDGEGEGDGEGTFGGNGGEGLYEPSDLTYEGVLQGFVDGVQNTDVISKGKDFFTVDTSGGTCPNFNATIPYINFELNFNQLCEPPMTDIWPLVKIILLATAGFVAFNWAWL